LIEILIFSMLVLTMQFVLDMVLDQVQHHLEIL